MSRSATHKRQVESTAQQFVLPDEAVHEDFQRGLKERHIQMIAIGGAIGVGLFLGSAQAIRQAGPSLLLAYAAAGVVMWLIMRALGELLLYRPVAGSFATYADEFVGPWAGFATAWTYWVMWVVIVMAEITAAGLYVQYWLPGLPQWIPALAALVVLLGVNLIAVGVFGEFEFWFAIIKVVTILGMIVLGLAIIVLGISDLSHTASFSNLWSHGGFFPKGFKGPFLALQIVFFAFLGVELLGVTAGEAQNPEKTIPSAINKVIWRILIFYIGALFIIMSLVAWNRLSPSQSPFVVVFSKIGIPTAAGLVNFVVLTAAMSSCNSGIYSTGRMLYTLAGFKQAPAVFRKVSRNKVPAVGMIVSFVAMLIGVVLNYVIPASAFAYITSVATVGGLFIWGMIIYTHLRYRKAVNAGRLPEGKFRMPLTPFGNWFALAFLAMVLVLLAFSSDTRVALYVTPIWVLVMVIGYFASRSHHVRLTPVPAAALTHAPKPLPVPEPTIGPTIGPTASPA
ncbi:MAG: amino acid permease [Solirubrobacteraceae bacterium]